MKKILIVTLFVSFLLSGCNLNVKDEVVEVETVDVDQYIGLSFEDAVALSKQNGDFLRVVNRDGEDVPMTADIRPGRLNATVVDDIVVSVGVEQ